MPLLYRRKDRGLKQMFDTWAHDPSYNDLWARAFQFAHNKKMNHKRAIQFAADYAEKYEDSPHRHIPSPATFEVHMAIEDKLYHHKTKDSKR